MQARAFFPEEPDGPRDGGSRRASTRPVEELRRSRGRPLRRGPRRGRFGGGPRLRAERQREDHPPLAPRRARRAESWFRGDRRKEISRLKESALAKIRLHEVGFVFQTHNLIDDLTVEENVALPLRLARKPADARVADLLAAFQLARLATRQPKERSVADAQLVAVARALANGPKVVLADEPTAALDAKGT